MPKSVAVGCLFIFFDVLFLLSEETAEQQLSQRHDHDLAVDGPCGDLVGEDEIDAGERENAERIGGDLESAPWGGQFRDVTL